jgi:hypothetical protein
VDLSDAFSCSGTVRGEEGMVIMLSEQALWDLVNKWQDAARERGRGPYLSQDPVTAFGQALNTAAEDLSDYLLDQDGSR